MTDDKKTLKQSLKDHYQKTQLNNDQLSRLQQLQKSHLSNDKSENTSNQEPAEHQRPSFRSVKLASALFITLLIGFVSGHFLSKQHYQSLQNESAEVTARELSVRDIAEEITSNHRKLKPLEVETNHFEGLINYFSMLDFRPYLSHYFSPSGTLVGGRYCSIGTISAAQIRYRNNKDEITTLFQTEYRPDTFKGIPNIDKGEQAITQYLNGYKVMLWVETGILMASVSSPE